MNFLRTVTEPRQQLAEDRKIFTSAMLKAMIVPLLIEQLLQMIVGLADTMMVSHAGEAVVAGVGLDTMIYTIFIYLFTAISAGGSVVVAQYIGSRDPENGNLAASQIFYLAGMLSLVCMVLMILFGSGLLHLMYPTTEPATMNACETYMRIVAVSFPANAVYNAGAALYRTMGRTSITMKVSLAANIINVIGNAVGIFVLRAGAAGVAWPTTISWYVAAAVMTWLCFRKGQEVRIEWKHILRLHGSMAKRILGVAVPNSVENTLFQAAKVVLGMLVATFGTSQIAANTTGQTFWSLAACMGISMGTVFITVIGQCVGANDMEAPEWYMRNSATVQPFSGPLSSGLRAAGDVKFTMWASIFATVICRTLLSYILALWMNMGVIGIALAMVLDWCIKGALDLYRFRSGKWKNRKVI